MAYSKCASCNSTSFESSIETPKNSRYKLQFIKCASCGAVVGVMDYYNIGALVQKLAKKMGFDI
ncbi:hypothetical protein EI546_06390 [Aequorivita sp. H23M31]|uniref:Uncharacterized protein n=1 Tax=Aequorivita ciconiae TaxID=2494375 RepID=A0A410G270_9FLAO|nr:hypothetical protein [Aequorivita sp. H23M31]QAA81378.1 hypothetical protein EI546_06390 [Aequorivita sp. H23M31]